MRPTRLAKIEERISPCHKFYQSFEAEIALGEKFRSRSASQSDLYLLRPLTLLGGGRPVRAPPVTMP